jgi:hypothetical protein
MNQSHGTISFAQLVTPRLRGATLACGLLLGTALPSLATDYYISPAGNDNNNGTSTATPWQSINKINNTTFAAGDRVLFQAGQTFNGNVNFSDENGTSVNPIVVSSYGSGRATINAGTRQGIFVYNCGGFSINNLNLVTTGTATNTKSGISFYTDLPGNTKLDYVRIDNVNVSGFLKSGIEIGAWPADGSRSGYRDVRITNSSTHDNMDAGISAFGYYQNYSGGVATFSHQNIYIGNCRAYNNRGIINNGKNTGSGIVLGSVDGVTIERCVAYNNGENNNVGGGGPVGIWVWNTNNALIQFNESYNNRTQTLDGGGFDLDGGVTNSVCNITIATATMARAICYTNSAEPIRSVAMWCVTTSAKMMGVAVATPAYTPVVTSVIPRSITTPSIPRRPLPGGQQQYASHREPATCAFAITFS